jgi:hypothetical protein
VAAAHLTESQIGTVKVPDSRVDALSRMYNPKKTIYAQVEYFLPAAALQQKEKGKEQSIWVQVRDCDALLHVVRNFTPPGMAPPDLARDFAEIDQELMVSDLVVAEKRLERLAADEKRGKKPDTEEQDLLVRCKAILEEERPIRSEPELAAHPALRGFAFLSAKPMLVLFNNEDEDDAAPEAAGIAGTETCAVIKGRLEQELAQMDPDEAAAFLEEFNITASAMDRIIERSYRLLGLISFFTVGEDEVRAWTIKEKTPAVEAAGAIHTDMQKGFIRAEVLAYDDLMDAGTFKDARSRGTVRLEGKTYEVKDGDIITFRFNV